MLYTHHYLLLVEEEIDKIKHMFLNQENSVFSNRGNLSFVVSDAYLMNKIKIKNLYSTWKGETLNALQSDDKIKPSLRVGIPAMDEQIKNDKIFFILDYLSYNPINHQIEKRILHPQRIMSKLYVGQSPEEEKHKDASVYLNGKVVVDELIVLKQMDEIKTLIKKIKALDSEVKVLKLKLNDIYKRDEHVINTPSRSNSSRGNG